MRNEAVERVRKDIHALLPGEPRYDAEEWPIIAVESEALFDRLLVGQAARKALRIIALWQRHVGHRIPDVRVDPVDDAGDRGTARADHAVEPHALLRRRDLGRIGGAHRRDRVRGGKAAFEEPDRTV